eukprot:TRINITY_DN7608_c0_g1_i1.p1 TRINITY_DN7608_c0_g1~~TRINITY_DN7608_c0_g1_i1.p1  ORF type:complete len:338 (-),score=31.66 TRINITY_DN7608_c0_g1_i1:51-1064(-)
MGHLVDQQSYVQLECWMKVPELATRSPASLTLCGSHNSGAINHTNHLYNDQTLRAPRITGAWVYCQSLSLREQCDAGTRFFDLRVSDFQNSKVTNNKTSTSCLGRFSEYFSDPEQKELDLCLSHRFALMRLEDGLHQLCSFLRSQPSEIILISITKDYDRPFTQQDALRRLIRNVFGDLLGDESQNEVRAINQSLEHLRNRNHRAIILTDCVPGFESRSESVAKDSWSKCHSPYVETLLDNTDKLWFARDITTTSLEQGKLSITQTQITPDIRSIIWDLVGFGRHPRAHIGLRYHAIKSNSSVCERLVEEWSCFVNVILFDFVDEETNRFVILRNFC